LRKRFRIPDPEEIRSHIAQWFRERIDLGPVLALMAKKTVPVHRHSWIYLLGGSALFLFALQVLTGALLMLYYQPTEAGAHQSVERIMTEVPFGGAVRSVHAWGADFFIGVVALHFVVKLFTRAYRKPREMTWLSGMLLLFVALAFGFSGYLLPWTELSYYATLVGTQIPGTVPVVGEWVVHFLRGGPQVTGDTLTRFFAAHVLLLPLVCGLLAAVHVALVQAQGSSLPVAMPKERVRDAMPFFSEFLLIELCIWLLIFGTIVTLATVQPVGIGVEADPTKPPAPGIKPEWYFLFMFQTLKHVPETIGVLLFSLGAVFLIVVPFLDRKAMRDQKSPGFTVVFVILAVYAAVFETVGITAPTSHHPSSEATSGSTSVSESLVSLALLWAVIAFLVFYLRRLLRENSRVRQLYR
jgi:cytochrome b6